MFDALDDRISPYTRRLRRLLRVQDRLALSTKVHRKHDENFLLIANFNQSISTSVADYHAVEVVGVAKTGHYLAINEVPASYVYLPYDQNLRQRLTLIVQSVGEPAELAAPLREAVRSLDSNVPVFNLRTVFTLYASRVTDTWLQLFQMVGAMGFIGLIMSASGLYGLIAYTVNRRVKEFGIRLAIGARPRDLIWLVERRGLLLAAIGIAAGGVLIVVVAPMLAAGFPGLSVSTPGVYILVPLVLLLVSAAASYVPARRAAGLDPLRALRNE